VRWHGTGRTRKNINKKGLWRFIHKRWQLSKVKHYSATRAQHTHHLPYS
jgi:hypothetical protein